MGKRSRKRATLPAPPAESAGNGTGTPPAGTPTAPRSRYAKPERPKAPWHPVPLVELCVLIGLVLIVVGFFQKEVGLLLAGLVLASLGGLDTALREHFNGYKSHTTLLAGLSGVLLAGGLYFARLPWIAVVAGAVLAFAGVFWWAREAFMKRSGGVAFR
jgi:hypothetical protein